MTKIIPVVVLILVQSVLGAQVQNVGQCLDNLEDSGKAGRNRCPAAEEYIRCVFVAMNVQSSNISETDLINLKNAMETNLTSNRICCNIDTRAILRKVNEDETNAATSTTKKPTVSSTSVSSWTTGYSDATTIGDCRNTFTGAITHARSLSCSMATFFLKCVIRVTGLYKYNAYSSTYKDTYSYLKIESENTLRLIWLFCNFDIKKLYTEVASEQQYRDLGSSTSVPSWLTGSSTSVPSWLTGSSTSVSSWPTVSSTSVSSWPTGYNGATTIEDCLNTLTGASTQAGSPSCSLVTDYLKCLIRVTGLYKYEPSNDVYSSIETQIENILQSVDLNCNFDIKELSAEVASEQKYRNSDSGLHTSVRAMLSLYTLTVAAWICSYFFLY